MYTWAALFLRVGKRKMKPPTTKSHACPEGRGPAVFRKVTNSLAAHCAAREAMLFNDRLRSQRVHAHVCAHMETLPTEAMARCESPMAYLVVVRANHVSFGERECVCSRLAGDSMPLLWVDLLHDSLRTDGNTNSAMMLRWRLAHTLRATRGAEARAQIRLAPDGAVTWPERPVLPRLCVQARATRPAPSSLRVVVTFLGRTREPG